jgi:hypothetical protein
MKKNQKKMKKWTTLDLVYTLVLLNHELSFKLFFLFSVFDHFFSPQNDAHVN